jgi:microcystin-dependent protein
MSDPFMCQIGMFSFNYPPRGYATCDGQTLPIAQNPQLYSLLGNMYGGNGTTTFALPDLRGRAGVKFGPVNKVQGTAAGEEAHTLLMNEMPSHQHTLMASGMPGYVPVAQVYRVSDAHRTAHPVHMPSCSCCCDLPPSVLPIPGTTYVRTSAMDQTLLTLNR